MQIFYAVNKVNNDEYAVKSDNIIQIGNIKASQQVSEDKSESNTSVWQKYLPVLGFVVLLFLIILIQGRFDLTRLGFSILALLLTPLVFFVMLKLGSSTLALIALDDVSHYLIVSKNRKTPFGNVLITEHFDIHEIENISSGIIQFKTGKARKFIEISSEMATEMTQAIARTIAETSGKVPEQRRKETINLTSLGL